MVSVSAQDDELPTPSSNNIIKVGDIVYQVNDQGYTRSHVRVVEEMQSAGGKTFIVNENQLGIWTPTKKKLRKASTYSLRSIENNRTN